MTRSSTLILALLLVLEANAQSSLFNDPELREPDVKRRSSDTQPARAPEPSTISPAAPESTPPPVTPPATVPAVPSSAEPVKPVPPPIPAGPTPQQMFASLYGSQIARVEGSAIAKDDLELARKLNEAARVAVESPGLQRLLYDKAYALAAKDPAGVSDAMHAVASLRKLFPAEGDLWDDRSLILHEKLWRAASPQDRMLVADVYRRMLQRGAERQVRVSNYTEAMNLLRRAADVARTLDAEAGDEVKELTRLVTERQRIDKRATDLIEGFVRKSVPPDATTVAEAAELLVGVLPRSAEARSLPVGGDKALAYLLTVAREPAGKMTAQQAAWMGDYFRQAADRPAGGIKASSPYRVPLLRASAAWYARFLAMHLPLDSDRLRVLLASQHVTEELLRVGRPAGYEIGGSGVALLTTVELARHRVSGVWTPAGGGLAVTPPPDAATPALLTLPVSPGEAYEVTMQFVGEGATSVGLRVPVGSGAVAVQRDAAGCSISDVKAAPHRMSVTLPELARDADRHTLYVRVVVKDGVAGILVAYDGFEVGRWEGLSADLAPPATLPLPDRAALGLYVIGGKAQVTDVSLNVLRGNAQLLSIPTATELPLDGSRPRDAVVVQQSPAAISYYHNGVTAAFDPALPGGVKVTMSEPSEDARVVRVGFQALMSNSANLAPLRTEYPRYLRLLDMVQSAPQPFAPADEKKLAQLYREHEVAATAEARQRTERALFAAMHLLGDRYQRSMVGWAKFVQKSTSPEEFRAILQFGKPPG